MTGRPRRSRGRRRSTWPTLLRSHRTLLQRPVHRQVIGEEELKAKDGGAWGTRSRGQYRAWPLRGEPEWRVRNRLTLHSGRAARPQSHG